MLDPQPRCPSCFSINTALLPSRIAARALQGIGGSGLYSLAQVCLLEQGPSKPEMVGALVGITLSISYVLGPLLGGGISAGWTWRGIFWIKLVYPSHLKLAVNYLLSNRLLSQCPLRRTRAHRHLLSLAGRPTTTIRRMGGYSQNRLHWQLSPDCSFDSSGVWRTGSWIVRVEVV